MLARELGCDAVISHHPHAGSAVTAFHHVMLRQIDCMVHFGVPINKAQKMLRKRMAQVELNHHGANPDRASSAARLLGLGYMNVHMPSDSIGINWLIAAWRSAGLEVIPCCGVVGQ